MLPSSPQPSALHVPALTFVANGEGLSADSTSAGRPRARLVAEGSEMRKIDVTDGMIAVHTLKDGGRGEICMNGDRYIVRSRTSD